MNTGLPLTSRHIKTENSHHLTITDPAVLAAEPQTGPPRLQHRRPPRSNRLRHPNDDHESRGDKIRQTRHDGLDTADQAHRPYHRTHQP